jgi:hypothetical protein
MKKIFTILFGTALLATTNVKAQAVEQGSVIIDAYYGLFSISNSTFKALSDNSTTTFRGIGPIGGRVEYMVSEKIGIGVDGHVQNLSLEWTDNITDTITGNSNNYSYKIFRQTLRIMPRINIHFGGSDNFDGYFGIAAGYRSNKWGYESTDPDYTGSSTSVTLVPVALRFAVGGRYFFTPNIGLNGEIGLGGGTIIHAGLTFKI